MRIDGGAPRPQTPRVRAVFADHFRSRCGAGSDICGVPDRAGREHLLPDRTAVALRHLRESLVNNIKFAPMKTFAALLLVASTAFAQQPQPQPQPKPDVA